MAASSASLEQVCPACGAAFRLADRRKRVQCPRCMEVIDVAAVARPAPPAAKELADLKARIARIDELEARTEALERTIAEMRNPPPKPPLAGPLPDEHEPGPDLHWHLPTATEAALVLGEISPAQEKTLVKNLSPLSPGQVVILAAAADTVAHRLAGRLRDIFHLAGWAAPEVADAPDHLRRHSLALTSPAGSHPQEMAALYMALAASGFRAVSQIDPALAGSDPVLSVGPRM